MPEAFSTLLTEVWSQVTSTVTTISSNALLLIPIGFTFVGGAIGIAKRLMRKK